MTVPADPGWAPTDDSCTSQALPIEDGAGGWRCELEPGHDGPHTTTIAWLDPVAEPDCETCSDTGQDAGNPCPEHCAAWARLHPLEAAQDATHPEDGSDPPAAPTAGQAMPLGRWGDD